MKLTGTVLRCSSRKVNSSTKETYVTNLLVLDPENSSGTNYAVEVWDDKPHQVTLHVRDRIDGHRRCKQKRRRSLRNQPGPPPGCGDSGCGVGPLPLPQDGKRRRIFDEIRRQKPRRNHPLCHSVYDPPSRVALEGGS